MGPNTTRGLDATLNLRVDSADKQALARLAKRMGRSEGSLVRLALREYLAKQTKGK